MPNPKATPQTKATIATSKKVVIVINKGIIEEIIPKTIHNDKNRLRSTNLLVRAADTKAAHAAAPELIAQIAEASNVLRYIPSRKLANKLKVAKYQVNAFEMRKSAAKTVFPLNPRFFEIDVENICKSNNSLVVL